MSSRDNRRKDNRRAQYLLLVTGQFCVFPIPKEEHKRKKYIRTRAEALSDQLSNITGLGVKLSILEDYSIDLQVEQ